VNTKQLRLKILDLAIRGKLVPQDPNDEPASVLLERIRAEKERLIKEKKIKRDKKDSSVPSSGTSHYQNVPQNWGFCRLSDIAFFGGGKTPSTENKDLWDKGSHLWVTSKDMKYSVIDDSLVKISDIGIRDMQVFPPLTILMVVRSGILRRTLPIAILKNEATINQDLKAICLYDNSIVSYIFWVLKASEQSILEIYQKDGTTVESINFEIFKDMVIPIPPFSEQRRIVTAIETAFALIDEIEVNKTSLEKLIKQTKFKVIDLAIRGKIVKQHHEDEPVSALIGKIGNKKNVQKITADISHYPYEIPKSWKWCKLGEIAKHNTGKTLDKVRNSGILREYITTSNLYWGRFDLTELRKMLIKENESDRCTAIKGDLLICEGGDAGRSAIWRSDQPICFQNHIHRVRPFENISTEYLYYFMQLIYLNGEIKKYLKGVGIQSLSGDALASVILPLPPSLEQQRIVQKIETILYQINLIQNNL
jgi:type I restriction enzyme S subunit